MASNVLSDVQLAEHYLVYCIKLLVIYVKLTQASVHHWIHNWFILSNCH